MISMIEKNNDELDGLLLKAVFFASLDSVRAAFYYQQSLNNLGDWIFIDL